MSPEIIINRRLNNKTLMRNLIPLFLMLFILIISPLSFAENRPGFVCGKFNGHVMEVPKEYIIYWAEYEGASARGIPILFIIKKVVALILWCCQ